MSASDRDLARSALFSGKTMKLDQPFSRGTSRFSITRLIGRAVLVRLILVLDLIDASP